ncbi:MAG: hypothetical protein LBT16_05285 [Treponema sp.]|jgi:DNA repair exonuclease SbcCD ATPase subunit|nr:hypothetical protein [Treponema sp.]
MITLERIRLVNWHNFEDTIIEIGNRCLLAGDNGSGKSTAIDAIQYAMAADLRKAKFNSAAGERKGGGRDLLGYVRCKLGSDTTEYLRGDTVSHVMLEFSITLPAGPDGKTAASGGFSAGVCVEAYTNDRFTEHFWLGTGISIARLTVRAGNSASEDGSSGSKTPGNTAPLLFRQFKDILVPRGVTVYESKKQYIRDFTGKLGVWKRYTEYNPYLESFTRSIGFAPLVSVDKFVCDYILEENLVPITDMKANLESYKEAERQAKAAEAKIALLRKICAKAAEWRNFEGLVLKQEYLKLRIERDIDRAQSEKITQELAETEKKIVFIDREISAIEKKRFDKNEEMRETVMALAANDAHRLYEGISSRIERLKQDLEREEKSAEKYRTLKSQCEILIGRKLSDNPDSDIDWVETEQKKYRALKDEAHRKTDETAALLREIISELAELNQGILRPPEAPAALRRELEKAGIDVHFLSEAADVTDKSWVDAVEGWLNTCRHALLVPPEQFQKALAIYDRLPRTVAGAFLPNLEKMRMAKPQKGSLSELIKADGYARIYLDYILGEVMRADIDTLKTYKLAVTRECMRYSNHTASRIREEVYKRHYLGQAALEERKLFLLAERDRLTGEHDNAEAEEREAGARENAYYRVRNTLTEMQFLLPALENCRTYRENLERAEKELAAVDTASFRKLEEKHRALDGELKDIDDEKVRLHTTLGGLNTTADNCRNSIAKLSQSLAEKEDAIKVFADANPLMIGECEAYAEKRYGEAAITELTTTYESTLKGFRSRTESLQVEYRKLVLNYNQEFQYMLSLEAQENTEAETMLKRFETSELPDYREKIARARQDAEKEFREHFISRIYEQIEEARESFREINSILRDLLFGRDQYRFTLEEVAERKGQIEVIRRAAAIPAMEEGLFTQIADIDERKAAEELFDRILNANLDSQEMRNICDYRTYFHYDIKIRQTDTIDRATGKPVELSLSRVLREKSGGETQTPYYVAIAASFYRFYKARPEETVRLVIFDEAFNRMDDERIGKILTFYKDLNLQIITSVPPEKIEAIAPFMDRINIISRYGNAVRVRDCHVDDSNSLTGADLGIVLNAKTAAAGK